MLTQKLKKKNNFAGALDKCMGKWNCIPSYIIRGLYQ